MLSCAVIWIQYDKSCEDCDENCAYFILSKMPELSSVGKKEESEYFPVFNMSVCGAGDEDKGAWRLTAWLGRGLEEQLSPSCFIQGRSEPDYTMEL